MASSQDGSGCKIENSNLEIQSQKPINGLVQFGALCFNEDLKRRPTEASLEP